jgi:hypothetical protein
MVNVIHNTNISIYIKNMSGYIKKKLEGLKWTLFEFYVRLAVVWVICALTFEVVMLIHHFYNYGIY